MKHILFLISIILVTVEFGNCQNNNVVIEGQILGYDGFSTVEYSLSNGHYRLNFSPLKVDSNGMFLIETPITKAKFFHLHFSNENEKDSSYHCKLLVQPNKNYSIVLRKQHDDDLLKPNSPDIYSWSSIPGEQNRYVKIDYGQMYFNSFDTNAFGSFDWGWDVNHPDSLLIKLKQKTQWQISEYDRLLKNGEIDQEFYDIAKLNVEYYNAYTLAQRIQDTWGKFFKPLIINDTTIRKELIKVYCKIFEIYPIEGVDLTKINQVHHRYLETYLHFLKYTENGDFQFPGKGESHSVDIDEIKDIIPLKTYQIAKMGEHASNVAVLHLHTSQKAKQFLDENPEMKNTYVGMFLDKELIPRSEAFDSLAVRKLSDDVIILDEKQAVTSFRQLKDSIGNYAILIDFWGTWCGPCRYQFKYNKKLKSFLEKNKIKMVYIAKEHSPNRKYWKELISAYDLSGYHFLSNEDFRTDFEKLSVRFSTIPTYIIVSSNGDLISILSLTPADGKDFYSELKEKLNL